MITVSKTLIEVIFVIGSLLALAVSSAFAVATIRSQLAMAKVQLEIRNDRQEFARKVMQNIDRNRVEIGVIKGEIRDVKNILKQEQKMKERPSFPEENIPPHTDFI